MADDLGTGAQAIFESVKQTLRPHKKPSESLALLLGAMIIVFGAIIFLFSTEFINPPFSITIVIVLRLFLVVVFMIVGNLLLRESAKLKTTGLVINRFEFAALGDFVTAFAIFLVSVLPFLVANFVDITPFTTLVNSILAAFVGLLYLIAGIKGSAKNTYDVFLLITGVIFFTFAASTLFLAFEPQSIDTVEQIVDVYTHSGLVLLAARTFRGLALIIYRPF